MRGCSEGYPCGAGLEVPMRGRSEGLLALLSTVSHIFDGFSHFFVIFDTFLNFHFFHFFFFFSFFSFSWFYIRNGNRRGPTGGAQSAHSGKPTKTQQISNISPRIFIFLHFAHFFCRHLLKVFLAIFDRF